jgi:CO/xanthine dehydrogenase FAD-binding subunit
MKGSVAGLELVEPRSLHHALALMARDSALVPIAGATDLYVALNAGSLEGRRFLDLWNLTPLRRITVTNGVLRIGALATYTGISRSRQVRRHLPMLVAAAREIGGIQIQNRGTLGGNIANASPAGDTLPVLAAAEAVLVLESQAGERRIPFTRFYTGYRATVRQPDELITAVEIPPAGSGQWFRKVGTRAAQAISKVVMAAVRAPRPRVALGSVAATVVRLPRTEAALAGNDLEGAVRELEQEIHPIDDLRSTAEYRKAVAANLLRRFWSETGP